MMEGWEDLQTTKMEQENSRKKKGNRRTAQQIIFICLATGQMIFYKGLVREIGSN